MMYTPLCAHTPYVLVTVTLSRCLLHIGVLFNFNGKYSMYLDLMVYRVKRVSVMFRIHFRDSYSFVRLTLTF